MDLETLQNMTVEGLRDVDLERVRNLVGPGDGTWNYNVSVPAERVTEYVPGGFHPVYINEFYKNDRYEILNKLGHGSFSTVWLARDHHKNEMVSIKVIKAENSNNCSELRILQHLKQSNPQHPGRKYVVQLLDHFSHAGPNGLHNFMVTKVFGYRLFDFQIGFQGNRFPSTICPQIARQLLLAIDYLHACGVVHGDMNNYNILFRLPKAMDLASCDIHKGNVSRKDGSPLGKGKPIYQVGEIHWPTAMSKQGISRKDQRNDCEVQLVDFSSAFLDSDTLTSIDVVRNLTPPELAFNVPLTKAVDIWGLACITYYCAVGRDLFDVDQDRREIIPQVFECLGESSATWLLTSILDAIKEERWNTLPEPDVLDAPGVILLEERLRRDLHELSKYGIKTTSQYQPPKECPETKKYGESLARYLRKMFIADPSKRLPARELLSEDFVQVNKDESGSHELFQVMET